MPRMDVTEMPFAKLYSLLVAKAEKKGRTRQEVDQVTGWLTGYTPEQLAAMEQSEISYGEFFRAAPAVNHNCTLITQLCTHYRQDLRRAGGGDRRPADASDPLSRQAGGRAGKGQADGEDSAEIIIAHYYRSVQQ